MFKFINKLFSTPRVRTIRDWNAVSTWIQNRDTFTIPELRHDFPSYPYLSVYQFISRLRVAGKVKVESTDPDTRTITFRIAYPSVGTTAVSRFRPRTRNGKRMFNALKRMPKAFRFADFRNELSGLSIRIPLNSMSAFLSNQVKIGRLKTHGVRRSYVYTHN